jgi:hypothetical protein
MRLQHVLALGLVLISPSARATGLPDRSIDDQISTFFSSLEAGQADSAVSKVIASSPLWVNKVGLKEQMVGQVDTAIRIYGPALAHDCPKTFRTGTMFIRKYCFAKHRLLTLRWQFDFVQTEKGWSFSYFGFTDQSNSWPDGDEVTQ